jgi:hypothetical protein
MERLTEAQFKALPRLGLPNPVGRRGGGYASRRMRLYPKIAPHAATVKVVLFARSIEEAAAPPLA